MATITATSGPNLAIPSTDESTQHEPAESSLPAPSEVHESNPLPPTEGVPNSDLVEVKQSTARMILEYLKENIQAVLTIVGVIIAFPIGIGMKAYRDWSDREITYVKFLGELYLNMFQGLVIPLITASMVTSVGTMDLILLKKVGGLGAAVFFMYNLFSGFLGTVVANAMTPGDEFNTSTFVDDLDADDAVDQTLLQDKLMDIVRAMFPKNVVRAALQIYSTRIGCDSIGLHCAAKRSDTEAVKECCIEMVLEETPNTLGLTVFSITLGIALAKSGIYARPVLAVFQSLAESTVLVTTWVMWVTPFATFALTLGDVLGTSNINEIEALVKYFATAALTLAILALSYPILYVAIMRQNPMPFFRAMAPAMLTASTTSSSLITIPILLQCLDEAKVNKRVSRILIPLGTRMNLNGTAAFCAVAAAFIGQVNDVGKDGFYKAFDKFAFNGIWIGSSALSMSTIGIPGGAHPTLQVLLNIIGVNGEHFSFVLPMEVLLDSMRTSVNVFGCAIISAAVSHWYHDELQRLQSYDLKSEEGVVDKLTRMKELTEPIDAEEEVLQDLTETGDAERRKRLGQTEHLMEAGTLPSTPTKRPKSKKKKRKFKLTKLKRKGSKISKKSRSSSKKKPSGVSKSSKESGKSKSSSVGKKAGKRNNNKKTDEAGAAAASELSSLASKEI